MSDDLKKFICKKPFENFEISTSGSVYFCCPDWLDKSIGSLNENSIDEIWNSESASQIRDSIKDGSYRYCNHETCPYIVSRNLITKLSTEVETRIKNIMLNNDLSCNLSCPSCRENLIVASSNSSDYISANKMLRQISDRFININSDQELSLNITGSGDPFASSLYRNFLIALDGSKNKNLKIELQSNGILFNLEVWNKLKNIHKNISKIYISIDASTIETYSKVRRGGDFEVLLANSKFLASLRKVGELDLLVARFVVQRDNFHEMESFANLFIDLGFDLIDFSMVQDWGTWNEKDFVEQKVWEETNCHYNDFLYEIGKIGMQHQRVYLGNLECYRPLGILKVFSSSSVMNKFIYLLFLLFQNAYNLILRLRFRLQKFIIKKSTSNE